jgi:HSP20 family molecular chaperone IbpA
MPFFPRFHYPESSTSSTAGLYPGFPTDILRMFEDLEGTTTGSNTTSATSRRAFSPNFDVQETEHEYILEGEVPGLSNKQNLSIEFTDDKTILIQGRIERSVKRWSDDQGRIQAIEGNEEQKNITESGEKHEDKQQQKDDRVQKKDDSQRQVNKKPKYWVSERSVGEFSRSFSFPTSVDVEKVKASLEHGILKVVVPKLEKKAGRKIEVS